MKNVLLRWFARPKRKSYKQRPYCNLAVGAFFAFQILDKAGADDAFLDIVLRELKKRGIDTAIETLQEDSQELVTIAGTQLGSKIDTGEWAYNLAEMLSRLWNTTKESALTFGLTNISSVVNNVSTATLEQ